LFLSLVFYGALEVVLLLLLLLIASPWRNSFPTVLRGFSHC